MFCVRNARPSAARDRPRDTDTEGFIETKRGKRGACGLGRACLALPSLLPVATGVQKSTGDLYFVANTSRLAPRAHRCSPQTTAFHQIFAE